jgi:transposase
MVQMTSTVYQHFMGIDIGKFEMVVAAYGSNQTQTFENSLKGWRALVKQFRLQLSHTLVILETTGHYELGLLLYLNHLKYSVHRANTRHVKHFIYSRGQQAKTDKLDAHALARYGYERQAELPLFKANPEALKLYELAQRRLDLKKIVVQEKNRAKAPHLDALVQKSCQRLLKTLEKEIEAIDQKMQTLIDMNPEFKAKQAILQTIPGIGLVTSRQLLCFMPELGTLNQKQVASLSGLAPYVKQSGCFKGQARIKGGRKEVRNSLFMAAMAARNSHSRFKTFYETLQARGKKPIVALTALMRKLIVIANAKLKEWLLSKQPPHSATIG